MICLLSFFRDTASTLMLSCRSPSLLPRIVTITQKNVPDGEDAAGLSEVGLLLDTTDSLLEDGRDLGGSGLGVGVGAGLDGGNYRCGISLLSS